MGKAFEGAPLTTSPKSTFKIISGDGTNAEELHTIEFLFRNWQTPTLNSAFSQVTGNELQYKINQFENSIVLRGAFRKINPVPYDVTVFTLPVGARPSKTTYLQYYLPANNTYGSFKILSTGQVQCINDSSIIWPQNTDIVIDQTKQL